MTAPAYASPRLNKPRRRTRIGLTPLIDVVFILLVFFMLASSFIDRRAIEVAAPAAALGGNSLEGALLIELRDGALRFSGRPVSEPELLARLAEHAARKPDQRVLIRPAKGVSLQKAVVLLDRVIETGLSNVSFNRQGAV